MTHSSCAAVRADDWTAEANCLRDMARHNPGAAALLLKEARAAARKAAAYRRAIRPADLGEEVAHHAA